MARLPFELDDQLGETQAIGGDPTTASLGAESPSLDFLRDLAHATDAPPDAFEAQLALGGEDVAFPGAPRFLVRRRLGAGGFGVVYEAFDRERNATVALKAQRHRDGRSVARFKNEFRSLVEVVHDNLVRLYELHAEGDAWFFTMELVRGGDALSYVRPPGGPFDEARLRAVLRQLAAGLSFLHRSGKLHRDVKPSNVMVTDAGRVVIVDFGLVHDLADLRSAEGIFGTPAYMAPEQAAGLPVGTAADWYAVGVMLYEALTGRLPFADVDAPPDSTGSFAGPEARRWPPPPPSALAANVPPDLDQLCVDLLARGPERRPTGRELRARLAPERRGTVVTPAALRDERGSGGEAPFIGRTAQLAALRDALRAAEQGATVTVLLHGRSGMGKSALVQHFLGEVRARTPGQLVLSGRCFEQESIPYKGVDGLVDDLCRHLRDHPRSDGAAALPSDPMLARLFPQLGEIPGLRPPAPADDDGDPLLRLRAFAALRALVAQAAPHAPVLVVDDLQWSDLDSTALLTALLHGPERAPLLLVTSYRAEDAETSPVLLSFFAALGALGALDARVDLRRVEVGALEDHEAETLSRALLVADDRSGEVFAEKTVQALVAEAHGDPFLLTELTRHDARARPLTDTFDSRGDTAKGGVPELGPLLTARIGRLSEPARRLLEVVALEGQPVARAIATRAAYGSERESEALGAISLLRAGRLIRSRRTEGGEELLPYHDRIREMVTRGLDPVASREHHHRLALALVDAGAAEPERLLFHYRSAGRLAEAARHAKDAAQRAHEALAFDRAARLYREALALGAEETSLHVALADALAGAGRAREAALATLDAARAASPAEALALRRRAAELLLGAGYVDEGLSTLRDVLRDLDLDLSSSLPRSLLGFGALRVRLSLRGDGFRERPEASIDKRELLRVDACYAAALGLLLVSPMLAAESLARHLLLALDAGEPFRVARALAFEAVFTALRRGPGPATDRLLATALRIERRMAHPHLTGLVRLCEGQVAQVAGQFRRAHDLVVESESVLRRRCRGVSAEIDMACLRRVDLLWNLGEVAELSRLSPTLLEEARERGNRYLEMMVQLSIGSLLGLVEGRPDRAREAVATALERWPNTPGSMLHIREIRAQARISLYEGRGDAALSWVEEGLAAARRTGLHFAPSHTAELHMLGGLAALSIGDRKAAAGYARTCARLGFPLAENMERTLRVGIARRAGDHRAASALLERAEESSRAHGATLYEKAMSRRQGEWMGGDEGHARIEAADAWMTAQGVVEPERMTAMVLGWV